MRIAKWIVAGLLITPAAHAADQIRTDLLPPAMHEAAAAIGAVWAERPEDAAVLYQVAALYARAKQPELAMEALQRMAATGAGLDPRPRDGFASLAERDDFRELVSRIRKQHPAVADARREFTLGSDQASEGMAWSERTKRFYFGSGKGLLAVSKRGEIHQLVAPGAHDLGSLAGIRIDDRKSELWVASGHFSPTDTGTIGVFRFRLPDGALIRRYPLDCDFPNDLAVSGDHVYVTCTNTGAMMRIDARSHAVEQFLPPGALADPNGVTATDDGRHLFVAGWYAVFRVDLATKAVTRVDSPRNISAGCIDGLYWRKPNTLIGVQNCAHATGRVMRYRLTPDRSAIRSNDVLQVYNPLFDGVTTGALAGDRFYFEANVQLYKWPRKARGEEVQFDPIQIVSVPVNR